METERPGHWKKSWPAPVGSQLTLDLIQKQPVGKVLGVVDCWTVCQVLGAMGDGLG